MVVGVMDDSISDGARHFSDRRGISVCLRFAVGFRSSGVCMFHVLILMSLPVLDCEVL